MPGRWVVFLSQNHLQLQVLALSSATWAAESLSSHTARSCALVVLAHLPSAAIPTCIDQPPAFVESHPIGGLPSRPGDYASHESIYDCLHDGVTQTSQKYLLHCQRLSPLQQSQARAAVRVPDLSTSVGAPSRSSLTLVSSPERLRRARPHPMVHQPQRHTRSAYRKCCVQLHPILR